MVKHKKSAQRSHARMSVADVATQQAFHAATHKNTAAVHRERELVVFKIRQADDAIDAIESALRAQKRSRRELAGAERGLNAVLEVRGSTVVSA